MALLSFRIVLLFILKLVIISEGVGFPGHLLSNNIFSNSLHYVSKHLNTIQPQFNLHQLLIPETYTQYNIYTRPNYGFYNVLQKPTTASYTKPNIEKFGSNLSTENRNNKINTPQKSNIENKDIDEKWTSFFDQYFKNQLTTDNINNGEIPQTLKDTFDNKYTQTTDDSFTDTTDTTVSDYETTTDDDDLLRNGVPPELLSSLLG